MFYLTKRRTQHILFTVIWRQKMNASLYGTLLQNLYNIQRYQIVTAMFYLYHKCY